MADKYLPAFTDYDNTIEKAIPFYRIIHAQTVDIITHCGIAPSCWLDTGCGTGNFIFKYYNRFPNTQFTLADPSREMLENAEKKLSSKKHVTYINCSTAELNMPEAYFDVITAIQCHHYLDRDGRKKSVKNCYRMLKNNGIFLYTENVDALTRTGREISHNRLRDYQQAMGRTPEDTEKNLARFNTVYFPLNAYEHIELLKDCGFKTAEIFWYSYSQIGVYGIK